VQTEEEEEQQQRTKKGNRFLLPAPRRKKESSMTPGKLQTQLPKAPLPLAYLLHIVYPAIDLDRELTPRATKNHKHNHSLAGKACYYGGDPTAAASHFRAAAQLDDAGLPAWEGVALTQVASGDYLGAAKTYEELVRGFKGEEKEKEKKKVVRIISSEQEGH